ncbi:glycoside hydrolase family 43 protein [Actinomadura keratinilytica]|uniref:Glycoside hydrolase family 43 protein n=1 Tax=Actinomadura keratinilytica TaxID=547461 RepID=A0ABP7YEY3_9ACTN
MTAPRRFRNPILPGMYPDPSVCRVGGDFYLVTSTFEWFPGLPVFHSRDLVHWRQIGHVLDRPSQLDLDGIRPSAGLYAPTIRHHDGTFYVVCTLVDGPGHFVVTATDPAGPWSEPVWLEGEGIDPSLFFDDDGRAWFTETRPTSPRRPDSGCQILLREFDPDALRVTGPEHVIWEGAARNAVWPEAPHLYKIDGRYVLVTAEGGTFHDHAVVVARSDEVTGPYEGDPRNPVLTHRHLGRDYPIVGTGHADLVDTPDGQWWMVLLAWRPYGGYYCNLGRETFLTPVRWEDGWPVAGPVEAVHDAPSLPEHRWPAVPACDHFDAPELAPYWNMLRTPRERWWSLTDRPGHLRLRLRPHTLADLANPSFVGRRQQHMDFAAFAAMEFAPEREGEQAGIALVLNHDYHVVLASTAHGLRLVRREQGRDTVLAVHSSVPERLWLGFEAHGQEYRARFATRPGAWEPLGEPFDGRFLNTQTAGGFTGVYVGMFASGPEPGRFADFDWFEYSPLSGAAGR